LDLLLGTGWGEGVRPIKEWALVKGRAPLHLHQRPGRGVAALSSLRSMPNEGPARCTATSRAGKPCGAVPLKGTDRCLAHSDEKTRESVGFGGRQEGAGRPRHRRPSEALRERVEGDVERWLAPFEAALGAVTVTGAPDHRLRIMAAERVLDRVYGRPSPAAHAETWTAGSTIDADQEAAIDEEIKRLLREVDALGNPSCSSK
jgi:hypothetical protein